MTLFVHLLLGFAAGVHGASYGAYKDAPYENFRLGRFLREIVIATLFAGMLSLLGWTDRQSPFTIFAASFAGARTITEFYKLFVRNVSQDDFRIPTRMHYVKGVVNNPIARLILGFGFLWMLVGIWGLCSLLAPHDPPLLRGLVVGIIIGTLEAMGGAYKDGAIEGFFWHKFIKSPVFGALAGLIAAGHAEMFVPGRVADLPMLMLATYGICRMLLELVYKMPVADYVPGKFPSMVASFPEWSAKRATYFIPPYVATWALFLVLATHPGW